MNAQYMADVKSVLEDSDYHCDWGAYEYSQLIYPAIQNNHAMLILSPVAEPVCFATWAFLSPEAETRYTAHGPIYPEDYEGEDGQFYMIDFAAPYGNCREMVRLLREHLKDRYGPRLLVKMFRPRKNHVGNLYTAWNK